MSCFGGNLRSNECPSSYFYLRFRFSFNQSKIDHSQVGNACPQVLERPGPDVPGWLLSTDWRPLSPEWDMRRPGNSTCRARDPHTATDHFPLEIRHCPHVQSRIRETVKNLPVWITITALVRLNTGAWEMYLLTYLGRVPPKVCRGIPLGIAGVKSISQPIDRSIEQSMYYFISQPKAGLTHADTIKWLNWN